VGSTLEERAGPAGTAGGSGSKSPEPRRGGTSSGAARSERSFYALFCAHLVFLFGIALSNIFLGLTILAAPFLAERRAGWLRRGRPLLLALAAYVALLGVSIAMSVDRDASLGALRELLTLTTLPLALLAVRDERRLRWLVDALILVAAGLAVLGLSQLASGYGSIDRRIKGPFSHVMTFSGVLLLIDLLLIARMFAPPDADGARRRPLDRGWLGWTCLALINVAVVTSLTRSAWIGLIGALLALVWVRRRHWLLAVPAAIVVFIVLAPVPVVARVLSTANLSDESTYDRLCMLEAGLKMTAEHPFAGIGPEMAERRYPIYRHPTSSRLNAPHLHNSYLQLAAERGLPALAAYLALVGISLGAAWRAYRAEGRAAGSRVDLYLGGGAALLSFSIAGLFENNWGDTEVQRMALFLLALPFCLRRAEEPTPAASVPGDPAVAPAGALR
jgi:putative inorganic carbon (HCO3(-)) transporter